MGVALGMGQPDGTAVVEKPEQYPPRAVWVLGALWLAVGVEAVAEMVQSAVLGHFSLNLLVAGLWIGTDVLRGRSWGQRWGKGLAVFGFVVVCAVAVLFGWQREWADCGVTLVYALGCLWMVWLHRRAETVAWFRAGAPRAAGWRDWRMGIVLAVATVCAGQLWFVWELKRTVAGFYAFEGRVVGVDAESGMKVEINSMSGVDSGGASLGLFKGFESSASSFAEGELHLRVGAFGPVRFEVGAEGYERCGVVIDAGTGDEVTIEMEKVR